MPIYRAKTGFSRRHQPISQKYTNIPAIQYSRKKKKCIFISDTELIPHSIADAFTLDRFLSVMMVVCVEACFVVPSG
jgi:hypothetical protein